MNILQNLCPHESILMILGVIMFSALIFAFVWNIVKEKKIAVLLPFFLIPIAMVGYPSLGSIQYEQGKFHLKPLIGQVLEGDLSEEKAEEFMKVYQTVAQSCKSNHDPEAQTVMAEAQFATGNYEAAREIAERTLSLQPQNSTARAIQTISTEQIQRTDEFNNSINQLNRIMSSIEPDSLDHSRAISQIAEILSGVNTPQNIESSSAIILARALAYTGENESALNMINRVLQAPKISQQDEADARRLQEAIHSDQFASADTRIEPEQQILLNANLSLNPEIINQQKLRTRIRLDAVQNN